MDIIHLSNYNIYTYLSISISIDNPIHTYLYVGIGTWVHTYALCVSVCFRNLSLYIYHIPPTSYEVTFSLFQIYHADNSIPCHEYLKRCMACFKKQVYKTPSFKFWFDWILSVRSLPCHVTLRAKSGPKYSGRHTSLVGNDFQYKYLCLWGPLMILNDLGVIIASMQRQPRHAHVIGQHFLHWWTHNICPSERSWYLCCGTGFLLEPTKHGHSHEGDQK